MTEVSQRRMGGGRILRRVRSTGLQRMSLFDVMVLLFFLIMPSRGFSLEELGAIELAAKEAIDAEDYGKQIDAVSLLRRHYFAVEKLAEDCFLLCMDANVNRERRSRALVVLGYLARSRFHKDIFSLVTSDKDVLIRQQAAIVMCRLAASAEDVSRIERAFSQMATDDDVKSEILGGLDWIPNKDMVSSDTIKRIVSSGLEDRSSKVRIQAISSAWRLHLIKINPFLEKIKRLSLEDGNDGVRKQAELLLRKEHVVK